MTNEEMFMVIMRRMDTVETGITNLTDRMEAVETCITNLTDRVDAVEAGIINLTDRVDTLETDINMEFWAVRTEMDSLNKSPKQDIMVVNNKVDRFMFSKDVEGYERMRTRVEVLERGYQELRVKTG